MSMICIPVPDLHLHRAIEIEVTVDGKKRVMNYRVESVPWAEEDGPVDQIEILRSYIRNHDPEWQLVQIGPPDDGMVAVTFRQHVPQTEA